VPQFVEQKFLMFPVFVIAETRDSYCEMPGRGDGDCTAFEAPDELLDSRALYDVFPLPPDEKNGSEEKEQNRTACTDELLELVVSIGPARRSGNQIFKRAFLDFGHTTTRASKRAIHLTAANVASGSALSRMRSTAFAGASFARVLDKTESASPIMPAVG